MSNDIFYREEFMLLVRDRQKVLYEGKVSAVTTRNESGLLDILPEHIHFIALIKDFVHLIKADGTEQKIPIDTGVVKVYENEVRVYLGLFSSSKK